MAPVCMDIRKAFTGKSVAEIATVVLHSVTERRGNALENVLKAGLENFVTKHAVKIVKINVTKPLAAARRAVFLVTLEIFVTKRVTLNVYRLVIRKLKTLNRCRIHAQKTFPF